MAGEHQEPQRETHGERPHDRHAGDRQAGDRQADRRGQKGGRPGGGTATASPRAGRWMAG